MGHWHVGQHQHQPDQKSDDWISCFDDIDQAAITFRTKLLTVLDTLPTDDDKEWHLHHEWLTRTCHEVLTKQVRTQQCIHRQVRSTTRGNACVWIESAADEAVDCDYHAHAPLDGAQR